MCIVDPDAAVREHLHALFVSSGYAVRLYANAEELLAAEAIDECRCLLVELDLPGLDGIGLVERLREREIFSPVIVLAGRADVPLAVEAMRAGACDVFEKPWVDRLLLRRVDRCFLGSCA